jgi:hypothetical protein
MLFWARHGSGLIPALERAYATGDEVALRKLSKDFAKEFKRRPVVPVKEGVEKLLSSPMYFDLLYGSKQLISRLALPEGIDYGAVGFAFNGGALNDSDFKILEYRRPYERLRYDTLLVKVYPKLTAIEREALELVGPDLANIGHATICPMACVALAAVVIALITCAGGCEAMEQQLEQISLTEDQLRQLGHRASASELLTVRRQVFEQHGI